MNHATIGVYSSGNYKVNVVRPEHLEGHIEYNKVMRFGRGLFVDGKCVNAGYLNKEEVAQWEQKISKMNIDTSVPSEVYV